MGFVSKEYRKELVQWYISQLKKLNLSDKTIGFFMRAYHVNIPIYFIMFMVYGSKILNICLLVFLIGATISFIVFDGCILSKIESMIDNEDITVVDPMLEIFYMEKTNDNRMYISIIIAFLYLSLAFSIFFIRFGLPEDFFVNMLSSIPISPISPSVPSIHIAPSIHSISSIPMTVGSE
jgi:hypothetical protein